MPYCYDFLALRFAEAWGLNQEARERLAEVLHRCSLHLLNVGTFDEGGIALIKKQVVTTEFVATGGESLSPDERGWRSNGYEREVIRTAYAVRVTFPSGQHWEFPYDVYGFWTLPVGCSLPADSQWDKFEGIGFTGKNGPKARAFAAIKQNEQAFLFVYNYIHEVPLPDFLAGERVELSFARKGIRMEMARSCS